MKATLPAFLIGGTPLPAVLMLLAHPCLATASDNRRPSFAEVGQQVHKLVEADWTEEDRDYARANKVEAFSPAHSQKVIGQAQGLIKRIPVSGEKSRDANLALHALANQIVNAAELGPADRKAVYFRARAIKRSIAFRNPSLQIDKLLFIKRHLPGGPFHMCDQYYGCNARPGGGLFVLHDPFTSEPKLQNLLDGAKVERGRLAGDDLTTGSFLSPEVSWDGKTILFAYTQAKARKTYQWSPEYSFHLFGVHADGSKLRQLTDGACDDFDPCFLPNGRVVFISTRRGGYLRCGRHCPVYTMCSMDPDGARVTPFSYHETHEWHPSVDNDGKVVYTRWDYVDRDTNVAHHIWTCYPDGRDPRAPHGNYPADRKSRPWMEQSIRAVPDSPLYVATTGAHHGNAFGSLVLIDPRLRDDGAMSQLIRLTPDAPFPEAETNTKTGMKFGTAWPLSEQDFLCAHDRNARNHGIYWIDRDGNRELIYRDPSIRCEDPIPLRPRKKPPIIPDQTTRLADLADPRKPPTPASVSIVDVYDSDFSWPPDTQIKSLRIIQVLPKLTAPPNKPRIGCANQTNARAVLGTVPVEPDGSAHFVIPSTVPVYFQALDEKDMAVMSMRSATYFQPGEQTTCQGCHENKRDTPPGVRRQTPLAFQRAPSRIRRDVAGSNPFNYPRLVQPVLDRNCVDCHQKEKAVELSGNPGGPNGWTVSYQNLAGKYGFYFNVGNGSIKQKIHGGSRTIPGQFGARAAPLIQYLSSQHHGVNLSAEDRHRITLWLDCNSEFYGAYEKTEEQSRGELVEASLQ